MNFKRLHTENHAARMLSWALAAKRPNPAKLEPKGVKGEYGIYNSIQECLALLCRTTGLTQEQLAFRIGTSPSMLSRAMGGIKGGSMQAPELEKLQELAKACRLRSMVEYLRYEILSCRGKKNRGRSAEPWWKEEKTSSPFGF